MPAPIINTIKDLVENIDVNTDGIDILPVCHTSRWDVLINEIIPNGNELGPIYNGDYNEDLLFFFYGKAKYIPEKDFKNEFKAYHPFTLVYDIKDKLQEIHRLVVFDSGGYDRYKTLIKLKHFELKDCDEEKLKRLITIFFKNNENYLKGKLTPLLNPKDYPFCGALKDYCKIGVTINQHDDTEYGEQAVTFEIQFKEFTFKDSLIAAVIPDTVLTSDISREQCKRVFGEKKIVAYETNTQAKSYYNMSDKVKDELYTI